MGFLHSIKDVLIAWTMSLVIDPNTQQFTSNALFSLFALAFAESSFFPIPPDVMLIAMAGLKTDVAFTLALVCSLGSVLGGAAGYAIGYWGGRPLIDWLGSKPGFRSWLSHEKIDAVGSYYQKYDVWAVGIAGFTPIPYKIFTIAAGVFAIRFWPFVLVSAVSRSARFFLVAAVMYFAGEAMMKLIDKNLTLATGLFIAALIGGFLVVKLGMRKPENSEQ